MFCTCPVKLLTPPLNMKTSFRKVKLILNLENLIALKTRNTHFLDPLSQMVSHDIKKSFDYVQLNAEIY